MNENDFFSNAMKKSLKDNAQLVFAKKVTIAIYDDDIMSEIGDIVDIINFSPTQSSVTTLFDNRSKFALGLSKVSTANLSIFFPLTREKFIIKSQVIMLNPKTENNAQNLLINKYNIEKENILKKYWNALSEEEKLIYETVDKDSMKKEDTDDLNKYTAQEKRGVSGNFSVCLFVPLKYEYTVFPMPQVIANTRKMKFESLLKPHKMPRKFLNEYDEKESKWTSVQLN